MVRVVFALAVLALALPSTAAAKFGLALQLDPGGPRVGQQVTIGVLTERDIGPRGELRLFAVAPRVREPVRFGFASLERRLDANPRLGFTIALERIDGRASAGTAVFPRPGRWRLVVPSWGGAGYTIPPPLVRVVVVRP